MRYTGGVEKAFSTAGQHQKGLRQEKRSTAILPWLILGLWFVLVISGWILAETRGQPVVLCPWKIFTGTPCPTCGTSRMLWHLVRLDPVRALLANPLALVILVWIVVFGILRLLGVVRPGKGTTRFGWWWLAAVLANWVYLIVRGG